MQAWFPMGEPTCGCGSCVVDLTFPWPFRVGAGPMPCRTVSYKCDLGNGLVTVAFLCSPLISFYFTGRSEFCFIDLSSVLRLCLWIWTKYRLWQLRIDFLQKTAFLLHALQYFDPSRENVLYLFNLSSESPCPCFLSNHLGVEQGGQQSVTVRSSGERGASVCLCANGEEAAVPSQQTLMEYYRS